MSRRLSTLRPPISTFSSFGIIGSDAPDNSGTGTAVTLSSELLISLLLMLSVDESEDRVDEQLDDLVSEPSDATVVLSGSLVTEDGNGELVDVGLSISSVGVVGGEDGFLISSESRELTPLDSLPTGETSCFLP